MVLKLKWFVKFIKEKLPMIKVMKMESSYLAWIDISELGINSNEFTTKLAIEKGVLLEDGAHFVSDGENYIRMNLGTQRENVYNALLRIEAFINGLI